MPEGWNKVQVRDMGGMEGGQKNPCCSIGNVVLLGIVVYTADASGRAQDFWPATSNSACWFVAWLGLRPEPHGKLLLYVTAGHAFHICRAGFIRLSRV